MLMTNDNETKFRQEILVPERLTETIFKLPCVLSAHKRSGRESELAYYILDPSAMADKSQWRFAHPGQWLCEDYDGLWHVLNNSARGQVPGSNE